MSEFRGTKGPWVADKKSRAIGPISKEDDQSYGMVIPVAWVEFDAEVEIQAANAQLIAAAPQLLEALQEAMKFSMSEEAYNKCSAAVSKALGQ